MTGKMLVAFDASEESHKAFDLALEMASSCKSLAPEIFVLSVVQTPGGMSIANIGNLVEEATAEFKGQFKDLEAKAVANHVKIREEITVGHPAEKIVEVAKAKGCTMILMGHKGRSKIGGLLLGSVSRHVASLAHCTVIIVR